MDVRREDVLAAKPDCRSGTALEQQAENVAVGKAGNTVGRTFALSVLAGMMIGMGASFMLVVKADAALSFAASQILGGLCFSLGLICVIVAGAELFTGNALMVCAAVSRRISWGALLKNWVVVFVGNLVGSLFLVAVLMGANFAGMGSGAVGDAMINTAYSKISLGWNVIFFRGIMCNVLVCLAVWMGFAGRTVIDKVFTTVFPVMAFVAMGFEHCVANMFFLPMGVVAFSTVGFSGEVEAAKLAAMQSCMNLGGIAYNISAATLGNIVGGAVIVGLLYWIAYRKDPR